MFGNTAPATTLPEPSKRFALLIGVNEYRKLDKDGGLELFDLRAPRNDVIAWYKFLRRMDVPAENIRVLTTPMLTPQELDDDRAVCAEASTGAVRQAVRWYFTTSKEHGNAGYGFVFLAGHGDFSMNQGYTMYLSDFVSRKMKNGRAVNPTEKVLFTEDGVAQFVWLLGPYGRQTPTTVLADVCRRSGTVTPPTAADPGGDFDSLSGHRLVKVIEATGTGEASYERCFDGIWRGQFTWAAMAILRNWPVVRLETSVPYVALTAELLAKKIGVLLSVFNHRDRMQEPTCYRYLDDNGQSPASPFMLPGVVAITTDYATDGLGHEFPAGTTDFKDPDPSHGAANHIFLRIVRKADTETHYTSKHTWSGVDGDGKTHTYGYRYNNGLTDFPSTFTMTLNADNPDGPPSPGDYEEKTYSTSVTSEAYNTTTPYKQCLWVSADGNIEMGSDQDKGITWRRKTSLADTPTGLPISSSPITMSTSTSPQAATSSQKWTTWTDTLNEPPSVASEWDFLKFGG